MPPGYPGSHPFGARTYGFRVSRETRNQLGESARWRTVRATIGWRYESTAPLLGSHSADRLKEGTMAATAAPTVIDNFPGVNATWLPLGLLEAIVYAVIRCWLPARQKQS
jgi:hypothetical protein